MGVMRNTSLSQGVTTVIELTKSKAEAKQLFDKAVPDKLNEGFTYRSDWVTQLTGSDSRKVDGIWAGQLGLRQTELIYVYNPAVSSYEFTTETS
jgi:hypothetical protein